MVVDEIEVEEWDVLPVFEGMMIVRDGLIKAMTDLAD